VADRIATGVARLNVRLKANAATTLTYRRGEYTVDIAMAIGGKDPAAFSLLGSVPGQLDLQQQNAANAVQSFSFEVADLIINGSATEPADGDEILWPDGSDDRVMTVMLPGDGRLSWDYQDKMRTRFTVRTQLTDTE
jgi:hypothetical protein